MSSPYFLPEDEQQFTGGCSFDGGLCAWTDRSAYLWTPEDLWTPLSKAPTTIDSGFPLQSGLLAGADTHVGLLPKDGRDWAWWTDLSSFSHAHPMFGDLLLCTDADTEQYTLLAVSKEGLDPLSQFGTDELADPVAGWSPPQDIDRVLLVGEDGLWALDPPYGPSELQHLVSFDDLEVPAIEDIPGPFQPGDATVVIPRRSRTALRLDLSDGTGADTGLMHLTGMAALWKAYLDEDQTTGAHLLTLLSSLPTPEHEETVQLYDILTDGQDAHAIATSSGLLLPAQTSPPDDPRFRVSVSNLAASPLDAAALTTWALWLEGDGAVETACRLLCDAEEANLALVESLQVFGGAEACQTLFSLLNSDNPPTGPSGNYEYPATALRALVAPFGDEVASLVASELSASAIPARVAASLAAGATAADLEPLSDAGGPASAPVLWASPDQFPEDALLANTRHENSAVRAAASTTYERLPHDEPSSSHTP